MGEKEIQLASFKSLSKDEVRKEQKWFSYMIYRPALKFNLKEKVQDTVNNNSDIEINSPYLC